MIKLNATNPLTGTTLGCDWSMECFQTVEEAMQMVELLYSEGFEGVTFRLMTAFEILTWWELSQEIGLTPASNPAEIWAARVRNRPELIPAPMPEECLYAGAR